MSNKPNRPVDMSDEFRKNGWEYCKYLITDPRSDQYLKQHQSNEHSKLAAPQQEGEEEDT